MSTKVEGWDHKSGRENRRLWAGRSDTAATVLTLGGADVKHVGAFLDADNTRKLRDQLNKNLGEEGDVTVSQAYLDALKADHAALADKLRASDRNTEPYPGYGLWVEDPPPLDKKTEIHMSADEARRILNYLTERAGGVLSDDEKKALRWVKGNIKRMQSEQPVYESASELRDTVIELKRERLGLQQELAATQDELKVTQDELKVTRGRNLRLHQGLNAWEKRALAAEQREKESRGAYTVFDRETVVKLRERSYKAGYGDGTREMRAKLTDFADSL